MGNGEPRTVAAGSKVLARLTQCPIVNRSFTVGVLMPKRILTDKDRERLNQVPTEIAPSDLVYLLYPINCPTGFSPPTARRSQSFRFCVTAAYLALPRLLSGSIHRHSHDGSDLCSSATRCNARCSSGLWRTGTNSNRALAEDSSLSWVSTSWIQGAANTG